MGSERLLLVTGGSRGIGAATALKAGTKDYFVCVNYRQSFEAAASVVDRIRERGGDAIPVHADVGREKDVTRLFDAIDALPGNLVGVVNNAGELASAARLENMNYDRWKSILTTNLFGTMCCTREGIRRMSRRFGGVGGAIVNVSSAASRTGAPNEYVDYAASKGAVDSFTIGVAREVAADGIRVNAVRPGSSVPESMQKEAIPVGSSDYRMHCRCVAPVNPTKWLRRFCGCFQTKHSM